MDIFTLLGGVPSKVLGITRTLMHDIEVEDHAEALLEYKNGACGYFYVSTCECGPGNLMEFVGDKAKMRMTDSGLHVYEYKGGVENFSKTNKSMWGAPETRELEIKLPECRSGHGEIVRNWAGVILGRKGEVLVSPGAEGIRSLELADAIQLSSWIGEQVSIPVNRRLYDQELQKRRDKSCYRQKMEKIENKRITDPQLGK